MNTELRQKILDGYKDLILEDESSPRSIFKFCRHIGITEKEFYDHFANMERLKDGYLSQWLEDTQQSISKEEAWADYGEQEKHLAFLFSTFEKLTENRSFVLLLKIMGHDDQSSTEKTLKNSYLSIVQEWYKGPDSDLLPADVLDKFFQYLLWQQFKFLMNFWKEDTSASFEKTDAAIEKSTQLLFQLNRTDLMDAGLDFLKFIKTDFPMHAFPSAPNMKTFLKNIKKAFP